MIDFGSLELGQKELRKQTSEVLGSGEYMLWFYTGDPDSIRTDGFLSSIGNN